MGSSTGAAAQPTMAPYQNWGWAYQILPYMDRQAEWNNGDPTSAIGAYACPSRRRATAIPTAITTTELLLNAAGTAYQTTTTHGMIDYAGNAGTNPYVDGTNVLGTAPNMGNGMDGIVIRRGIDAGTSSVQGNNSLSFGNLAQVRSAPVSLNTIPDGASNTLLVAEKWMNSLNLGQDQTPVVDDSRGYSSGWTWEDVRWGGVTNPTTLAIGGVYQPIPDSRVATDTNSTPSLNHACFGSAHSGGIFQAVLCDGSVRSLTTTIDGTTFVYLCCRKDGQKITLPP
jgi:hypothetical protein